MDVGCPKCQTEYELDDARVTEDGVTVKCTTCGHVFRVKKKQLVVTLPSKGDAPISLSHDPQLPPAPPSREWKLRQPNGNVFPCRDLTMLQKWIIEKKVSRDDEISLSGETWKRLGNIPELASFFQVVDDAAKARTLEAMQKVVPPPPPAPSAPPTGGKITDTWRGGQFSEPAPPPQPPEPPRRSTTSKNPEFMPEPSQSPVMQTLQGGRFSAPPPAPPQTTPAPRRPPPPEPSEEDLRRAVGKGGGSGKWIALILAGLAVGGGVGWYFGYYEPEQKRLAEQRASEQARLDEEARVKAAQQNPVKDPVVLDASVEAEAEPDAGAPDAGAPDAGVPDAGVPDAGAPVVDAGAPIVDAGTGAPVVTEQKKSFDWYLAQGDRLRERDKPEQALDFYGKAADLKPDRVEPMTGRGLALLDMANPSAAEATFEQALKLNSRYGPAIMGLAEAYRIAGKNEKAIEYYQRYLDVLPNGAEAAVARNSIERLKK